jgi:hypothetical protein
VAQVIKAYVEKERRQPTKVADAKTKLEIGAVWNDADPDGSDNDALHGGHFVMDLASKPIPLATAAPGVN